MKPLIRITLGTLAGLMVLPAQAITIKTHLEPAQHIAHRKCCPSRAEMLGRMSHPRKHCGFRRGGHGGGGSIGGMITITGGANAVVENTNYSQIIPVGVSGGVGSIGGVDGGGHPAPSAAVPGPVAGTGWVSWLVIMILGLTLAVVRRGRRKEQ